MDPVALAIDESGRLYVAEMADYPLGPASGRVKRLEDTNGDGRMDKVSLFAEGLPYPTSVQPWKGGVFVTAAPDILYLKDGDGDGKADERRVVFTGFTPGNPQHRVNGLQFAIDGWIYGANGDSGGMIRTKGGVIPLRGVDFRFDPETEVLEPIGGQSQFAMTFDEWGRRFINDNTNHIRHPVLPIQYLRRQPHLAVPAVQESISDHGDPSRIFPTSRIEKRFNDEFTAGHFTSACSVTIWGGDAFVCEPVHNLIHRDRLVPKGASFTATRAYPDSEFLTSTDNWFRPVFLCPGPDGSLYVADFYRRVVEHPQWIPLQTQKEIDLRAGHDRGRIYRIVREGTPSHYSWQLMTRQRLILEKRDRALAAELRKDSSPVCRLRALWTLDRLGDLTMEDVREALGHPEAGIREHALRLAESRLEALREPVLKLAEDPHPRVRFQVALTLSLLEGDDQAAALSRIAARDSEDRWIRTAVLIAVKDPASFIGHLPKEFLELPEPGMLELVRRLAGIVASTGDKALTGRWISAAGSGERLARWQMAALSILPSVAGSERPAGLRKSAVDAALDGSRDPAERAGAVDLIALGDEWPAGLDALLRPQEPGEVQVAAARAMRKLAPDRLLEGWSARTRPVRREVIAGLLASEKGMGRILDALEKGEIRAAELEPPQRQKLMGMERGKKLLSVESDREGVVQSITEKVLSLTGDRVRGEKMYQVHCMSCHRRHGQGCKVGPGLEGVTGRDRKALLVDILDPNRAVDPAYQVFVIKTAKGEFSGIVASETPTGVTLRRALGEDTTILRKDIVELKAWPASLMAEGVESNISAQEFADLLEFLRGR